MKVGLLLICTGENYWPYAKTLIASARTHFLPGKDVDYLLWTDMPDAPEGVTVFPTEQTAWPYPTLMRYHLFLGQEEYLQKYDYLFYVDADMVMVDTISDEIVGTGLTAAQHPMYALRKEYQAPYEPNPKSAAFILPHFYYAGGFQGGKREDFVTAMKEMKKMIDNDLTINYLARWNDESHWNKYLYDRLPSVILTPAYVYPDSLINEYYIKLWGCDYPKKIITLTKPFTLSKQGGDHIKQFIQST